MKNPVHKRNYRFLGNVGTSFDKTKSLFYFKQLKDNYSSNFQEGNVSRKPHLTRALEIFVIGV
jgi:hypothetical protein